MVQRRIGRSTRRSKSPALASIASLLTLLVALAGPTGLAAASADAATSAPVQLTELEVERKREPVGVDVERPRFSWVTTTDVRDVEQRSYRVLVREVGPGSKPALVWDSGVVRSERSSDVEYAGPTLESAASYTWEVRVVTDAGTAVGRSTFGTGLYDEQEWGESTWIGNDRPAEDGEDGALTLDGASWIWTPEATTPVAPAEPRAFRATLTSPQGTAAVEAELLITADDLFEVWVNGRSLGRTAGANNEWQQSHRYTTPLDPTRNVVAVRTDNGAGSPAGLVAAVRVRYADGTTSTTTTSTSWKASKEVPAGFEQPGFDDSAWATAVEQAPFGQGPWGGGVRPPAQEVRPAPILRKEFQVRGDVARATLFVAAGGYADVSLNGAPIDDEVLSPGFTDYDDTVQYVAKDLTQQLRRGENTLGMELGRGFYGMTGGNVWRWESPPWHDEPVARAVLRTTYADGSTEDVVTDDSWTIHDGPTVFDDLYAGETYDARLVKEGFDTVGFDDTGWVAASEVAGPRGELVNQRQQPIRVTEALEGVEVTEPVADTYVVKFPRVLAGWVEVSVRGPAGTTVRMQYGERLRADGLPDFSNNGGFQAGFQSDRFVLAGTGVEESWEAGFSYKGFQYVQVTGWPGDEPPTPTDFVAKAVHTDAAETGSFSSSSDIMNRTHRAVVDTLLNNLHGIPTDTPMFEKNGWTGDAAVGAEMFLMNLDSHELLAKWMRDVHESRDEQGRPYVIAPSSGNWGDWGVVPPWHSAYVMIPWWLYQYGGDERVMTQNYEGMKTYVELEFGRSPGGVVPDPRLGDWVAPEASPAGGNPPEDLRVSGTAYLYAMLTTMQRTAEHLGKDADAARFAEQAAVVKAGFNQTFLDAERGLYRGTGDRGYRQTHNVLALAFDLAPDRETAQRVADSIAADVEARGTTLNTGVLGTKYLLPVLTQHGHADVAHALAVQTDYPSWGFMIENGATSMWEHWSLEARSRGHYFLGTVDDWFFHDVAGIQPSVSTGYRDITVAPAVTGQMDWARARTQTPFGPVSSSWRHDDGRLRLEVQVPVGSTATVHVPAANAWAVTEGGKELSEVDGVREVRDEADAVLVRVGSGRYVFTSDSRAGLAGAAIVAADELAAQVQALRAAGVLDRSEERDMLRRLDLVRRGADGAVEELRRSGPVAATRDLASGLGKLDDLKTAVARLDLDASQREELSATVDALREALSVAMSDYLQVTVTVEAGTEPVAPGTTVPVVVGVDNGGQQVIGDVVATVTGPDGTWHVEPGRAVLADRLGAGGSGRASFDVTVSAGQDPGDVPLQTTLSYRFGRATVSLVVPVEVRVTSPLSVQASVEPDAVRPGGTATVRAVVVSSGGAATRAVITVAVPEGWLQPAPVPVDVPADGEAAVAVQVQVPRDAAQEVVEHDLTVDVGREGSSVVLATTAVPLRVEIDPAPVVPAGYDHVDLGDAASEEAHRLTAAPSSGTSPEAGLTRRYAGHLTAFSWFEHDVAVVPGQPFVLRVTETYDRAQTKRYKVYVDGGEVLLRTHERTDGAGTVTYEVVVPAVLADADGLVRLRFENQDDPTYFDPSIADVWTLPVS